MRTPAPHILLFASLLLLTSGCSHSDEKVLREQTTAGVSIPEEALAAVMARHRVPAVSIAVMHGGRIDWAEGYGTPLYGTAGRVDTTTLFQAASISKPVAAAMALRMVERGLLALDEDVNVKLRSWKVPESPLTKRHPVTLRGLLSHSAGLTMHGVPEFDAGAALPALVQILDGAWPDAWESVCPVVEPGTVYRYSGGGYIVLQVLLTDVTGGSFAPLAEDLVLRPAGMSSSTFEQPLPSHLHSRAAMGHLSDGTPMKGHWHTLPEQAAGGLWTTPRDLASFALAIWRSYHGKPDALLSRDTARLMLTRQVGEFGLGFSLPAFGVFRFQHGGANWGYRCFLVLSVESGDGVVIMTNSDSGEEVINIVFKAIASAYGWST